MKNHLDTKMHPTKHYGLKAKSTLGMNLKNGIKSKLSGF